MSPRYNWITHKGRSALEHVVIASRVLGRELPRGAEVHHVDENGLNNCHINLVICPDKAYNRLLHVRMRALASSGNPSHRKCHFCRIWDSPNAMRDIKLNGEIERFEHPSCQRAYQKKRYWEKRL